MAVLENQVGSNNQEGSPKSSLSKVEAHALDVEAMAEVIGSIRRDQEDIRNPSTLLPIAALLFPLL